MIVFAYPPGLLLLLTLPLLLFLLRSRARPRRRPFTAAFLLEALLAGPEEERWLLFRLNRRVRALLAAAGIVALSLALSGAAVEYSRQLPERWLVVFDNPATARREFDGTSSLDAMKDHVRRLAARMRSGDRLTLLVTSPAVSLRHFDRPALIDEHLAPLAAAAVFPTVAEARRAVEDLSSSCTKTVVLSPRSAAWRSLPPLPGGPGGYRIVPDRRQGGGNAGFVAARLKPAASGLSGGYDLFLAVAADGSPATSLPVRLLANGVPLGAAAAVSLAQGRGRLLLTDLRLAPGTLVAEIPGEDAYPPDNRFTLEVPDKRRVAVSVNGKAAPVFGASVASWEGFSLVEAAAGEVAVLLGDVPDRPDRPSLVIYPRRDTFGLSLRELAEPLGETAWHPDHPITAALRDAALRPARVMLFEGSERYQTLGSSDGVPLVLAGKFAGQPVVIWTFDPLENGIFLSPDFVILVRESILWLSGSGPTVPREALGEQITRAGAAVATPALPGEESTQRFLRGAARIDLVRPALLAALALGLVLALAAPGPAEPGTRP